MPREETLWRSSWEAIYIVSQYKCSVVQDTDILLLSSDEGFALEGQETDCYTSQFQLSRIQYHAQEGFSLGLQFTLHLV